MWLSTEDYERGGICSPRLIKMLSERNSKTYRIGNVLGDDNSRGSSSIGRALSFQVGGCRFDPCLPLQ
jgi:hypothetical protein